MVPVQIKREEWIEKAQGYSEIAAKGKGRPFVKNAPKLHLQEEAARHIRAAEAHCIACNWLDAANHYKIAAYIWGRQLRCPDEAASLYMEAARLLKKVRPSDTETFYDLAISELCDVERYELAGRAEEERALAKEAEGNLEGAIRTYQRASNYYLSDGRIEQANAVTERAADLTVASCKHRYMEAALLYEELGMKKLEDNLTKRDACNYFFKVGLLLLAGGSSHHEILETKLLDLKSKDNIFKQSRQHAFLQNIFTSMSVTTGDLDLFADHVYAYDKISQLDPWTLKLLAIISQDIEKQMNDQGV